MARTFCTQMLHALRCTTETCLQVDAMRRCTMRLLFLLVWVPQLANCLPIVDPGLFVIMGVRSCRAGAGYCLLGLDCTLDEDFLPDDQGGHCDGLRSAFTPSAHFICCRYNAANRTIPHLPYPGNMGQDVADNDLAPLGDYTNTDTLGPDSDFPSGSNFVQNAESSALEADSSIPLESSVQPSQVSLPSNVSLKADDNGTTATTDISDSPVTDTMKYEDFLVAEAADFNAQDDDALQSNSYTTEMFTDIYTTAENFLRNTEMPSLKPNDTTANTERKSEEYSTVTEPSVTQMATQIHNQSSSAGSGVKLSDSIGDRDSSAVGHSRIQSDNETSGSGNSSLKNEQVESRDDLDRTTLSVRGIMVAHPSMVSARSEIVVRDDNTRHRNVKIKNRDVTTLEAASQTTYYRTELSASVGGTLTGSYGMVTNTVSHRDTVTESYSAVTVSETGTEETVPSYVDNMANTTVQPVFEDTVVPVTDPNQGLQDTTTVMESESGEASSKLYGDTKLLQQYDQNLFVDTSEYSGYQTNLSALFLPTELDNSLERTVTETHMSATQNLAGSESDVANILSESESIDNRQAPEKEPGTAAESNGQHFFTQILYKDIAGTGVKMVSSKWDKTDTLSQPSRSASEISKNILNFSEISNEVPVTIPTTFTAHETTRNVSGQTMTLSEKDQGTKPEYITYALSHKESDTVSIILALKKDSLSSVLPKTTEGLSVVNKEVSTTDHTQKPELSGLHETTLSLNTDDVSMQTDQVSSSRTITEHVNSLGTQQLNEITTEFLTQNIKTSTVSAIKETLDSVSSSSAEATTGHQLKSGTQNENHTTVFLGKDSESPDNSENITESIPTATIIHSEITVTSEATRVLPVVLNKEGSSSPSSTMESSNSFSIMESSNSSITTGSSIPTNTIPELTVPSADITRQQTTEQSPLCGEETSGTKCWLVQFMSPYSSNSSVCVGSYLDSNTIVTSAGCVSRVFDIGVARVTLLSAGGAVTQHTMIRDIIVHEEYRNRGVKVLLNDVGLVRLNPGSRMPPAACALCLPKSDHDLMDTLCIKTSLSQVKPKLMPLDIQIGSPMVCSGGVLAGVASYHNPHPVYTPISDYVTWIRANQKTHDPGDEWK